MVRDPYWLHVYWELSRRSIDRARAAMGQHWHQSRPVLRLHEVSYNGTTSSARQPVRDIEIHGGVNNWYIDVHNPPKSYQVEIGYLAPANRFYSLARSNIVRTPSGVAGDTFDKNWAAVAKDFDRIYAMSGGYVEQESNGELKEIFEEHLRRPMGDPMTTQFGHGAAAFGPHRRRVQFAGGNRVDRPRRGRSQRPRHTPRRAGPRPPGRDVRRPFQPARPAARVAPGGQQLRRRRAADDRPGRRSQHQGDGAGHPQSRRVGSAGHWLCRFVPRLCQPC